ncbi:MAG: hypothetical protein HYZ57_07250, partial [Acidobacteria bacterium]|nr:hypothetical protein [Acidobacteriota bacterium]
MRKLAWFLFAVSLSPAAVHKIYLVDRTDVLNGASFGAGGAYERIVARVHFRIDPKNPANRIITDIDSAPLNEEGLVEFSADLYVLKPRDPAKANGTILFEVSNRGNKGMLGMFNRARTSPDPAADAEFGDKFLLEEGFTLVWLGWQYDIKPRPDALRLEAPVARQAGKTITGPARAEYVPDRKVTTFPLGDRDLHFGPVPDDLNDPSATLYVRDRIDQKPRVIPRKQWEFADAGHVFMAAGFEPGKHYEVVYRAKDPGIAGLGPAGVRDIIAFLKYDGGGLNLLGEQRRHLKRAIGFGTSQSGRFLRTFLYQGFNADEKGRRVFDGLWPHVAGAGRGSFNHRFAAPSRDGQTLHNYFYPADLFPFTDAQQTDPELGLTDSLLAKAEKANVVPRIFYTNASYEYWGRAAWLIHTSVDGKQDVAPAKDTRIYYLTGGQHGAGSFPPQKGNTRNLSNPNDYRWAMRGLLMTMHRWLKDGVEPPASQYPLLAKDQLVPQNVLAWPKFGAELPRAPRIAYRLDFGPEFRARGIVSIEPPKIGNPYPVLLPQVDADGNETAGVRLPCIEVPLGTYAGWNQRSEKIGAPTEMIAFTGSFFPFARTRAERLKMRDPRPSLEERYKGRQDYLDHTRASAEKLAAAG